MAAATSLVLNIIGNNRAQAAFASAGSAVSDLGDKVKKYGLLAAAGAATAAVGITAMAVDFTKAALEDEASASKLVQTMQKTQGATKEQIKSTEDWISKMGVATGVADDDLRPALASLMIAGRTTAQAQSDVAVAMDIAAAKGLDLETVTKAMAKAAQGNTGALGKLGVATKDAEGNMLSYEEVLANATKTMGGASAAAADTTAGRFKRLSLVVSELKESIGYALLPVLTDLAGWFLDKGLPALNSFGNLITGVLGPAVQGLTSGFKENDVTSTGLFGTFEMLGTKIRAIATWVQTTLIPALSDLWSWWSTKILPVMLDAAATIGGALMSAFNSIKGAIQDNQVQLQQLWTWFQTLYEFIAKYVYPVLVEVLATAFKLVGAEIGLVINIVGGLVDTINWLVSATQSASAWISNAWGNVTNSVQSMSDGAVAIWDGLISWVANIPSRITGALGDLSSLLYNAGLAVLNGFWNGLKAKWEAIKGWVSSIGGWIQDLKGPMDYDKKLLIPQGNAIMDSLGLGLKAGWGDVQKLISGIAPSIAVEATGGGSPSAAGVSASSTQTLVSASGGGTDRVIAVPGDAIMQLVFTEIRKYVRTNGGGNVQIVFGS